MASVALPKSDWTSCRASDSEADRLFCIKVRIPKLKQGCQAPEEPKGASFADALVASLRTEGQGGLLLLSIRDMPSSVLFQERLARLANVIFRLLGIGRTDKKLVAAVAQPVFLSARLAGVDAQQNLVGVGVVLGQIVGVARVHQRQAEPVGDVDGGLGAAALDVPTVLLK